MLSDEGRSFGHWRDTPKKRSAKPDAANDQVTGARPSGDKATDPTHDNLETIAGRRQKRERLLEAPVPPAPAEGPQLRDALKRLAERKLQGEESGDVTAP